MSKDQVAKHEHGEEDSEALEYYYWVGGLITLPDLIPSNDSVIGEIRLDCLLMPCQLIIPVKFNFTKKSKL